MHEADHGSARNGGLDLGKADGDAASLMGDGKCFERAPLQQPLGRLHEISRDFYVSLEAAREQLARNGAA